MEKKGLSTKKATYTALCIIPPNEIWPEIQEIRLNHDPAYSRWMPHINLAFPFIPPEEFEAGQALLQAELSDFPVFKVTFKELGYFANGKKGILWAKPEIDANQLEELEKKILKVFPFCDDQIKKSKEGFHPHLTLGNFDTKIIEKKRDEFAKTWTPKEFMVNEVNFIKRDGQHTPFYVVKTVSLKTY